MQKRFPDANKEACSLILSGIAAELLPDHNDSKENNAVVIQIVKSFIPVLKIIHAMVTAMKTFVCYTKCC